MYGRISCKSWQPFREYNSEKDHVEGFIFIRYDVRNDGFVIF